MKKKNYLLFLVIFTFSLSENYSFSNDLNLYSKYQYQINTPKKIKINILGNNYIKYLKQIKQVSKKDNLNTRVVNSSQKKWIKTQIRWSKNEHHKAKIKLHGDWNDHISLPYSSLRIKSQGKYFGSLKEFILLKPITRNYNGEIFATILMQNLGFLAPYTSKINVKINDYPPEMYLIQEKINKNFIERAGFREAPIIEYDERHRWHTVNLNESLNDIKFANIYKIDNQNFIENPDKEIVSPYKLTLATEALSNANTNLRFNSEENILFEVVMSLIDACHGIIDHNRKYYYESVRKKFIPIYYDGMAFDYNKNFCLTNRVTKNDLFFNLESLELLSLKFFDKNFKEKIKKKYLELTINDNVNFEVYWKKMLENFFKYKEITLSKSTPTIANQTNYKDIFYNLSKLNLNYPLIYYYVSQNNEYLECIDWKKSKYKKISSSDDYKYIKSTNEIECKKISNYRFINNIKNNNFYYSKINKDIKIYPTFLGVEKYKKNSNIYYVNLIKGTNDIFLEDDKIYFLIQDKVSKIDQINIISKNYSKSAVIILGTHLDINKINYTELAPNNKKNVLIQNLNLTGCVNIYDLNFNINEININNASCEDALNIVRSKGTIENILINKTISDGVDFDFSDIEINNTNIKNSGGDCIDLSFGNYKFKNINVKNCIDKGISVGEKSSFNAVNLSMINNNTGIAIKDSSVANITNINQTYNNNTCISLYNKKPEFNSGKLYYIKIPDSCIKNTLLDDNSRLIKIVN